ncbi:regulator of chromosome condensation (RCC1) repeat [Longilinea arvoryzae]|uniref:Regulator of chromosome condensation (RCC1) repeat n=1 Tax=Longilinea arvoryzae TaxID=360412 RepID=A0A0S7B6C9_9CHLR|nr:choice-of-anchor Q domain-containing protein [Longilinea arvoryzae]GAP12732.1 regulator of chromosome condensation (RCC1) repeat [Longilinea arvoryzae]
MPQGIFINDSVSPENLMNRRFSNIISAFAQLFSVFVLAFGLLGMTPGAALGASNILYVVPGGTGAGTSWASGMNLDAALDAAASGSELWVKVGYYQPTIDDAAHPSRATFELKNGVALYGGFAGNETARDQRQPAANVTILSGTLGYAHSLHVVTGSGLDSSTVLDGFTISDGASNTADPDATGSGNGGGIYLSNSSPTLANLTLTNNSATLNGGGMYNDSGSPTLSQIAFSNNSAGSSGGGMYNVSAGNPVLANVTFEGNSATDFGGGIFNYTSSLALITVAFTNNTAGSGGGMYDTSTSHATLTSVTFDTNQASSGAGGGLANNWNSDLTLNNVTFTGNLALVTLGGGGMSSDGGAVNLNQVSFIDNHAYQGGGMYLLNCNAELTGVVFSDNLASGANRTKGGGMYNEYSNPRLTRVIFHHNGVTGGGADTNYGGGIYNLHSSPALVNVAFERNYAIWGGAIYNAYSDPVLIQTTITAGQGYCSVANCGSGIYNAFSSQPTLQNSIVWGNAKGQIDNDTSNDFDQPATTSVIYSSIIQGSGGSGPAWVPAAGIDMGGNLDLDPRFVTASTPDADGDLHLQSGSPAINNGSNSLVPNSLTTDLSGSVPRILGNAVDMGAYEYTGSILPPQTTITAQPASVSNQINPAFTFSSDTPGSAFKCKLDTGEWADCTSPQTYPGLADGSHTFQVQALVTIDSTQYVDWTPASYTWTIDATANVAINSHPADPAGNASAEFTFYSLEPATFECQLDSSAWEGCANPKTYSGLAEVAHTFAVRAIDALGNVSAPASYTWTIDLTPPDTTLESQPANPATTADAAFTFSSSETGSTFLCRLDGGAWAACSGASDQTYTGLSDGNHTFDVKAADLAGNEDPTPATYTWLVAVPPETAILSKPPSPVSSASASFTFSSNETGSSFECRLDNGGWVPGCTSPQEYSALADGSHTFEVRASDPADNTDPTPAGYTWIVDTQAQSITIDSYPPNPTANPGNAFTFSSPESGVTFECKLNASDWTACTSPTTYYPLPDGDYTFQVRSVDAAGNVSTAASYAWTIAGAPMVALPSGEVSSGLGHACAILPNGGVQCWGSNSNGQAENQTGPYTQISAGAMHTCALTPSGAVDCWGDNEFGQAEGQSGPYVQVSSSFAHTCGLTREGAVHCWGMNGFTQYDFGQAADQTGPYTQISVGLLHTCGLTPSGSVDCWGIHDGSANDFGQAADQAGPYTQVSAGYAHTCALTPAGAVHCWGNNDYGQSGDHAGPYVQVSVGQFHTCALSITGAIDCWGNNNGGQTASQPGRYRQVSAGGNSTCALTEEDTVHCWGDLELGQAGPYGAPETFLAIPRKAGGDMTFDFFSDDPGATFECQLDAGGWEACQSPAAYASLTKARHAFQVRAVSATGARDSTPAAFTWTNSFWIYLPLIGRQ